MHAPHSSANPMIRPQVDGGLIGIGVRLKGARMGWGPVRKCWFSYRLLSGEDSQAVRFVMEGRMVAGHVPPIGRRETRVRCLVLDCRLERTAKTAEEQDPLAS